MNAVTLFMVFSVTYTICEGLYYILRGLKVPRPLIANTILFVNISSFLKWKLFII